MKRTLIAGTIALLAVVLLGSMFFTNEFTAALMVSSFGLQLVRVGLIIILAALLIWSPPRSLEFRIILGGVAAGLFLAGGVMLFDYRLGFIDSIIFIEVAIIFALEALETPELVKQLTASVKKPIMPSAAKKKTSF